MLALLQGSLEKRTEIALANLLRLAGILLAALVLIWLLRVLTHRLVALAKTGSRAAVLREQQTRTLAGILYSGGTAVIVVMAMLTALPEFGINITPIAAAAGLVSLGIGFGELRADVAWSDVLVDGRVLGVESLGPGGTALRVMARTVPLRHDDLAREFRRRVKARFEEENISLSSTQRVEMVRETNKE